MSLFGRRKKPTQEEGKFLDLKASGSFDIDAVGEANYQKALKQICGGLTKEGHNFETEAYLIHEDDNPHDNKAIQVVIDEMTVGYLSRENARVFRKTVAEAGYAGYPAKCAALIVGGWDRGEGDTGHFGVKLDF